MKQECSNCKSLVEFDEAMFQPGSEVEVECPICGASITVTVPEKQIEPKEETNKKGQSKSDVKQKHGGIVSEPEPVVSKLNPQDKQSKMRIWAIVIPLIVVLAILGVILHICVYQPYAIDRDALRTYVYANTLNVRSSEKGEVEYNIIEKASYGSELITYDFGTEWSYIKYNGEKGYVASAYLMGRDDFEILNSIWGNSDSRNTISTAKCRKALLDFYKFNDFDGGVGGWQFFSQGENVKPNTVFYPRLYDKYSRFTDFVFILQNNSCDYNILAVYSFDRFTEAPILKGYYQVSKYNYLISNIRNDRYDSNIFIVTFAGDDEKRFVKYQ